MRWVQTRLRFDRVWYRRPETYDGFKTDFHCIYDIVLFGEQADLMTVLKNLFAAEFNHGESASNCRERIVPGVSVRSSNRHPRRHRVHPSSRP